MKKIIVIIIGILVPIVLLVACNSENAQNQEVYELKDSSDEVIPHNIDEIIDSADYIVKGTIGELEDKINMIGTLDGGSYIPSEDFYTEGHVHSFKISNTFKGNLDGEIKVILPFADEYEVWDEEKGVIGTVTAEFMEYEKPEEDAEYIFFLVDNIIGDNMYSQANMIFQIKVNEDDSLSYISKRIEGQLPDNVQFKDGSYASYISEEVIGNYKVIIEKEFEVIDNHVEGLYIEDLIQKIKSLE